MPIGCVGKTLDMTQAGAPSLVTDLPERMTDNCSSAVSMAAMRVSALASAAALMMSPTVAGGCAFPSSDSQPLRDGNEIVMQVSRHALLNRAHD